MKYRTLGQGLEVSAIGIGCMPMVAGGNIVYGEANADDAIETIHRAIDLGVTFFDTAEIYGPFQNEELVGRAIRGKRDNLVIAIAARTISSNSDDGKGVAASRIQGTLPPFESFAANRFRIGDNWQLIKIETRAPRAYGPGGAELELYFGGTVQEVDLGPVYVFKVPATQ